MRLGWQAMGMASLTRDEGRKTQSILVTVVLLSILDPD